MKIFVAHSSGFDYTNELYLPIRNNEYLKSYSVLLPKEKSKDEVITGDIIKNSDVVLAEVSYPSTGQGIELGWADIYNVPIVCIYKEGFSFSGALKKLTNKFYMYRNTKEMLEKINEAIELLDVSKLPK